MPLWNVKSVSESLSLTLARWCIVESKMGERHFVGYNETDRKGRVSSAILEVDPSTLIGRTRSGRIYQLQRPPRIEPDAAYVWNAWCSASGVKHWEDVTEKSLAGQ